MELLRPGLWGWLGRPQSDRFAASITNVASWAGSRGHLRRSGIGLPEITQQHGDAPAYDDNGTDDHNPTRPIAPELSADSPKQKAETHHHEKLAGFC